jgi:hypothetical protein
MVVFEDLQRVSAAQGQNMQQKRQQRVEEYEKTLRLLKLMGGFQE